MSRARPAGAARGAKRGEIFPPKLRMSAQRLAQLPLRKRLLSRLPTRVFGGCFDPRRDLFGELIHLVERAIDLDPQILDEAGARPVVVLNPQLDESAAAAALLRTLRV